MISRCRQLLALVSLQLLGCSAIVKELDVSCSIDDDCAAFIAAERLGDEACYTYQCSKQSKVCKKQPRDSDHDDYPDLSTCSDAGVSGPLDCDDDAGDRHPDAAEECDGVDNDCDQVIDEEVFAAKPSLTSDPLSRRVDFLSYSDSADGQLSVALTNYSAPSAYTVLESTAGEEFSSSPLQGEFSEPSCTRGGRVGSCALQEVAIATTPDMLIALGIQVLGCAAGQVRVASRRMDAQGLLRWDGDSSGSSNLLEGVAGTSECPPAPGGARAPSLAIASGRAVASQQALALWRASKESAGELAGVGLSLGSLPDTKPSVKASGDGDGRAASLSGPSLGMDGASLRPWREGFFVAYDVEKGLELAFVSGLERGAVQAFETASRLSIPHSGARHPALALSSTATDERPDGLGLAWRSSNEADGSVHFVAISVRSGSTLAFNPIPTSLELTTEAAITDGPVVAYVPRGFAQDVPEEAGGWLVAWIELEGGRHKLMGARVKYSGDATLEAPFVLAEDSSLEHAFVYAASTSDLGYGFVTGNSEQQLNIGSLTCKK